ncbi:MAG: aminotransferase class IV [Bacteroidia bacterium]|nr:aminotransferase class IV [Bacteroidia bacterium]
MKDRLIAYDNGNYVLLNDLNISPDNLAFGRSFGVFDFFRAEDGVMLFLEDHLARFENAQSFLFEKVIYSHRQLTMILNELQSRNKLKDSTYKLILSGIIRNKRLEPYLIIINNAYTPFDEKYYKDGCKLLMDDYSRAHPSYKSIYYLNSFRRHNLMQDMDAIDILYYSTEQVTEASRSNVFIVKNNTLYTPQTSILMGVTRKAILDNLSDRYDIKVMDFGINELLGGDEVFLSSTLKKIMPVVQVGEHIIGNGKVGPMTLKIMDEFKKISKAYIQGKTN